MAEEDNTSVLVQSTSDMLKEDKTEHSNSPQQSLELDEIFPKAVGPSDNSYECRDCSKLSVEVAEAKLDLSLLWAKINMMEKKPCQCDHLERENSSLRLEIERLKKELQCCKAVNKAADDNERQISSLKYHSNLNCDSQEGNIITNFRKQLEDYRSQSKEKFFQQVERSEQFRDETDPNKENLSKIIQERDSLRTVISVLMQDSSSALNLDSLLDQKSPWTRVTKEKKKKKKSGKGSSNRPTADPLITSNRYSSLKDQQSQTSDDRVNGVHSDSHTSSHAKSPLKNISSTERSRSKPTDAGNNSSSKDSTVLIIGDFMIKGLRSDKICRSTSRKVTVKPFPGSTVNDMNDYIEPSLRKKPESIILHVGTNNIGRDDPKAIADNICNLHKKIKKKSPKTKVAISSLVARFDHPDAKGKIDEVNKHLSSLSKTHNFDLISNSIDKRGLNKSMLHLNTSGDALLAKSFINTIRHF